MFGFFSYSEGLFFLIFDSLKQEGITTVVYFVVIIDSWVAPNSSTTLMIESWVVVISSLLDVDPAGFAELRLFSKLPPDFWLFNCLVELSFEWIGAA